MNLSRAIKIQEEMASRLILEWSGGRVRLVAGADSSYDQIERRIAAVVVVLTYPGLEIVETSSAVRPLAMPYVPGFLAFREGPAFMAAFRRLKRRPDVTLLDGNGIAHPRKMGLASYVGVKLDIPTIGCAKTPFFSFRQPDERRGSWTEYRNRSAEKVGICLRTRAGVRPVFVSPGHRVDFPLSRQIVLGCSSYRLPEPLREAHRLSRALSRPSNL
jgi:deoxyribonuclease V